FDSSTKYLKILNYPKAVAVNLNNMAFCYQKQANYPEAIYTFKKSLAVHIQRNDIKSQCGSWRHIGAVYEDEGNIKSALDNLYQALSLAEKINDPEQLSECYNDI